MLAEIIKPPLEYFIAGAYALLVYIGLSFAVYNLVAAIYENSWKGKAMDPNIEDKKKGRFKSKKPCRYPGCPELTHDRYCEKHKRIEERRQDRERGNSTQRGYNYRWHKARKQFLKEHPLCECDQCLSSHTLKPANVVHHIVDHKGNYDLFWDRDNWLAMNKVCHDKHTLGEMNKNKAKKVYKY